ncbi:MAG: sugar ABC transporter ATP-binding protein, partial [Anaerolineae bacterium]|nr:sugar ABC transporter ATP-binding protein [Anaerolineae bacterium]
METPNLEMRGITKSFPGVQALKNVNLEAFAGEALALIGANGAGKSTLMNVLGGVLRADEGDILIGGKHVEIHSPPQAAANGIAFVHQEMAMLPTMTIMENIHIGAFPTRAGLIDRKSMETSTKEVLERVGCHFEPNTRVQYLSTGDRQMVEIARALLSKPGIIIFDEPTSSLTSREKARLFEVIRSLKADGVTIIYITHFLDEIFDICERATVLRGGVPAGSGLLTELTIPDIVHMMIGDLDVTQHAKKDTSHQDEIVLKVTNLSRRGILKDIDLTLHKGEILGLWGLLGSGRTEVARALVGLDPIDDGQIEINVRGTLRPLRASEAQKWIGMVTEDRRNEGLLLPMSVKQNMSLANLRGLLSRWKLIDNRRETVLANRFVKRLNIVISTLNQPVQTLSGGNQQKVVVGRWLELNPPIFIMDEPTRGLDVGAKAEIRNIIFELAESGAAILLISSEIEDIMALAQRYLVMHRGQIIQELPGNVTRNDLMAAAVGAVPT